MFINTFALPIIKSDNDQSSSGALGGASGMMEGIGTNQDGNASGSGNEGNSSNKGAHWGHLSDTCSNVFDMSVLSTSLPSSKGKWSQDSKV